MTHEGQPPSTIASFTGPYRFLSNFWPVDIEYGGLVYPSVEHAYQASKSVYEDVRADFADFNMTAGQAKRHGKRIVLRDDWDAVKLDIMCDLVTLKFARGTDLAAKLLATRDAILVEGNTWGDTYWGKSKVGGVITGRNHLGRILMTVRSLLRHPKGEPHHVS
jgi:ribA/ribD-fused uncharacterized protein